MSQKTITKKFAFVILFSAVCLTFSACSAVFPSRSENPARKPGESGFEPPRTAGRIESAEIRESSGLVASRCQPGVFWTHNDSGDEAYLFALDAQGERRGTWKVTGAKHHDWEDIAQLRTPNGECVLLIGDIGNNTRARDEFVVYRVKEPKVGAGDKSSSRKKPLATDAAEAIRFVYPDLRRDAETLLAHPETGDLYVISKRLSGAAGVYRLRDYAPNRVNKLEKIADLSVPAIPDGFLTGGDIAPDGKSVVLCDYYNAYELRLPAKAASFDDIWKEKPVTIDLGPREQGEAVAYSADGAAIFATSENKGSPLIEVRRRK